MAYALDCKQAFCRGEHMSETTLSAIFDDIHRKGAHATLSQQLDWLQALAEELNGAGSLFSQHSAYHPLAVSSLRINLQRLQESPLAFYLNDKLKRVLGSFAGELDIARTEQMVISSSFVISTLVDMLDNPEQPFEIAALMYESQSMFDDWYDQLLEMTGLRKRG